MAQVYRVDWDPLHRIITLITPSVFSLRSVSQVKLERSNERLEDFFFPLANNEFTAILELFSFLAVNLNLCFAPKMNHLFNLFLILLVYQIQIRLCVTTEEWV